LVIFFMLLCLCTLSRAQTWESVQANPNVYVFGEGWGETVEEADKQALSLLISKISVIVSSDFELLEDESKSGKKSDYQRYIESKVSTYSGATLTNTDIQVLKNEPNAHVARWIKRSELDNIFAGRKTKVLEYVNNAINGEKRGKADDALRNYYWALSMLKTLQHPAEMKFKDSSGVEHVLVSWLPEKLNEIFNSIIPSVVARNGDNLELFFTYNGRPVTSLDYTYFDGKKWSNIYSASDGRGVLELSPGAVLDNIQLKYEYAYKNEALIDRELYDVINTVQGVSMRKSYVTISSTPDENKLTNIPFDMGKGLHGSIKVIHNDNFIRAKMDLVINAIREKNYESVYNLFTPDGFYIFRSLISYGKGTVLSEPKYRIYMNGDNYVVRSIPMSFSFKNGVRKSFAENVVFTFNKDEKIDCIAFALDSKTTRGIFAKTMWPQKTRIKIVEFLENYKTAYALKRLDYIRSIFDDDAVIVIGKMISRPSPASIENRKLSYAQEKLIRRTRYTKEQYLKNLEKCFYSNEFVNIRFANSDVQRAGKGGELYGIQIKQDYYSTHYGDSGYLFLLLDINNPEKPMIEVRTWQKEPDPVNGLFDLSSF
jgi:hypothetical protein